MIKRYDYNCDKQIAEHFNAKEFNRCRCGKNHSFFVSEELVELLEKLRAKLNAKSLNIYSGFRCTEYDKKVGGSGSGPHTEGYAVDCYLIGPDGKRIPSREVCMALEDLGHQYGVGYRCGGSADDTGQTHIDVKPRKWFGNEAISMSKSVCSSWYDYFGVKKPVKYEPGKYKLNVAKAIRTEHKLDDKNIVKVGACYDDVRKNLTSKNTKDNARYKVGTIVDITEIYIDETTRVWGKLRNCWIVLCNKDGTPQAQRI